MLQDIWKRAGKFRNTEKNIGVKKYKISSALKQLEDDCLYKMDNNTFNNGEIAIRFTQRLVLIHCFSNSNGRHSRFMAGLIIEKLFSKSFLTWGGNNLVKKNSKRDNNILTVKKVMPMRYNSYCILQNHKINQLVQMLLLTLALASR